MSAASAQDASTLAPAASGTLTSEQQTLFESARTDFLANHFGDALPKLQQLHQQIPGNTIISKFAAEAAVNTGDFPTASSLLQPVLAASPEDPQALGIEAHLYGQQHDVVNRDALLDRLQKLHDSGKISLSTVIVEKDALPDGGTINFCDFLQPWSRFHIVFLAEFYDNAGHRTKRTAIESDDIDQVSFARDHPKDAAAGVRVYSMDSYSEAVLTADGKSAAQTHATLCPVPGCFMTGRPTYEFFRDFILNKDKPAPISSSTTPMQPGK